MTKPITINPAILSTGPIIVGPGQTVVINEPLPTDLFDAHGWSGTEHYVGNRLDPRNRGVDYMAMIRKLKIEVCENCGKKKQGCGCDYSATKQGLEAASTD